MCVLSVINKDSESKGKRSSLFSLSKEGEGEVKKHTEETEKGRIGKDNQMNLWFGLKF